MLSKQDLVARLKSYEFSKLPHNVKDREACARESRPHGIGNALRGHLESAATTIVGIERYDLEVVDMMYVGYGFVRSCYDTIKFKELEDHREEPAVDILFRMNDLLPQLGRALDEFAAACARTEYNGERITATTPGYEEFIGVVREIRKLDEDRMGPGAYKRRVLALERELAAEVTE